MNFIQRNKSIFIFGIVIGLVFAVIIVIGWRNAGRSPVVLTPFQTQQATEEPKDFIYIPPIFDLNRDEGTKQTITESGTPVAETQGEETIKTVEEDKAEQEKIKVQRPAREVSVTAEGFRPRVYDVHVGQIVRFTNTSETQMTIQELANKQSDKTPKILNPGEQLEIEMVKTGYWTVKELNSGETARYYVGEN